MLFRSQKRDEINLEEPSWVYNGKTILPSGDEAVINQYFIDNPQMMLGNLAKTSSRFGRDDFIVRPNGTSLTELLDNSLNNVAGEFKVSDTFKTENKAKNEDIVADDSIKNFCFGVKDGKTYYRENDIFKAVSKNTDKINSYTSLSSSLRDLINCQLDGNYNQVYHTDLNRRYDQFTKKYGYINDKTNARLLKADIDYYLVSSIENKNEDGSYSKGDIFTKQTIRKKQILTTADTPLDALRICLNAKGKVDLDYMSSLYPDDDLLKKLNGEIYIDPVSLADSKTLYIHKDEYLSGNVRQKLVIANEFVEKFPVLSENINALNANQPKFLNAEDIAVRLSTHWIDDQYINQFLRETFELKKTTNVVANYSKIENLWRISNKSNVGTVNNTSKFGTQRITGQIGRAHV